VGSPVQEDTDHRARVSVQGHRILSHRRDVTRDRIFHSTLTYCLTYSMLGIRESDRKSETATMKQTYSEALISVRNILTYVHKGPTHPGAVLKCSWSG
jgi:hypothetical protein